MPLENFELVDRWLVNFLQNIKFELFEFFKEYVQKTLTYNPCKITKIYIGGLDHKGSLIF